MGGGERVVVLDVLRGFAILGILLVNMPLFFSPIYVEFTGVEWWTGTLDQTVERLITFLAQGKFYSMFSLLFGVGIAIQMQRTEARGARPAPFLARRLSVLLLIGGIHAFLIWFGDILVLYASLGLVLLLFLHRGNRTLFVWAIVLLSIPLVLLAGTVVLVEIAQLFPEMATVLEEEIAESRAGNLELVSTTRDLYATGGFSDIFRARAGQVATLYSASLFWAPNVLALFLIGFNLGRRGFFGQIEQRQASIRRWLGPLLLVGILGNGIMLLTGEWIDPGVPSVLLLVFQLGFTVGAPALSFFYVGSVALLAVRPRGGLLLRPLAAVGRMALTNYLTHSIVFTTLANGYGGGLYGRISPTTALLLTLATFALQIVGSNLWLQRFRFGPAEWVWRSLTYGRRQPMLRG